MSGPFPDARHGEPWTIEDDDDKLLRLVRSHKTLTRIREEHQRSEEAIARMADKKFLMPNVWPYIAPRALWGTADSVKPKEDTKTMHKFYQIVSTPGERMTKAQALERAEREARKYPADTFYVMESVQAVSLVQPKVAVTTLKAAPKARKPAKAKRK